MLKKFIFIVLVIPSLQHISVSAEIFRCVNSGGKIQFTDNPALHCEQDTSPSEIGGKTTQVEEIEVEIQNLHSQFGTHVSEDYYTYSQKKYTSLPGFNLSLFVEKALLDDNPELTQKAAQKLANSLKKAKSFYPSFITAQFSDINYFIFRGENSSSGGRKGGQWYFRRGNRISKRFDHSIVIRSAQDYVNRKETLSVATAIHELAHAYYYLHRKQLLQPTRNAYHNALTQKLYQNVKTPKGNNIKKAYAMTNEREYFAEMAVLYFYTKYHQPFNKKGLKSYDPTGYQLMQQSFIKQHYF